ncbi:MAG: hypothetical protein RLZZ543_1235 [Bacteroidota bacterium]|jgi:hypothetical protein
MKKIIAILCLAAFSGSAMAAPLASALRTETSVVSKLDKDKDKDKKKKSEKACCSKDAAGAKSCHDGAKSGAAATGANAAGSTEKKACCSKDAKSCDKDKKHAEPAK